MMTIRSVVMGGIWGTILPPRQKILQFPRVFEEKNSKKFLVKIFSYKKFENPPLQKFLATSLMTIIW